MTTLLVDADIFAFKASSACEGVYYFGGRDEDPAVAENLDEAIATAERLLEEVANKLKATRLIICLTDDDNFRLGVYPQYKGNRKDTRRPSTLKAVKAHFAKRYDTYQRPGLEADDCMGILSTHKTLITGKKVIVSSDKDMQTIPGLLFNPDKDTEIRKISEAAANRYFLQQTITGDTTDGYPGCPGVGPKSKFVQALADEDTVGGMWKHVVAAYESKGLKASDALVQARCARILRASDWDFQNKRVRLWSPPPPDLIRGDSW
jgi:DNA polymerase-1